MRYIIEVRSLAGEVVNTAMVRDAGTATKVARNKLVTYPDHKVFVTWHRPSDNQSGYLNPPGNHDVTAKCW